jgi:hypothetical protein
MTSDVGACVVSSCVATGGVAAVYDLRFPGMLGRAAADSRETQTDAEAQPPEPREAFDRPRDYRLG